MAPVKRRPAARSHRTMKSRRRRPNIPSLVYKFLRGAKGVVHSSEDTCQNCGLLKDPQELTDAASPRRSQRRSMANRRGNDTSRGRKSRVAKRRQLGSNQLSPAIHKAQASDDLKEIKSFIQKALDFGVKSGYLEAKDDSERILRVSSELLNDTLHDDKVATNEKAVSQEREHSPRRTPNKVHDYREVETNKRRRKRKRSRKRSRRGSKKRRRISQTQKKRSRSQVPEPAAENMDGYESENAEDEDMAEGVDRNVEDTQLTSDGEKNVSKGDDEETGTSTAEDESDEDDDKKGDDDTSKS